jgi:hypothetical protein
MRDRKFDSSSYSFVGRCQILFDADMDPTLRALLVGLIVLMIAFASGLGASYLL